MLLLAIAKCDITGEISFIETSEFQSAGKFEKHLNDEGYTVIEIIESD